jgi:acyl-CoA thioesterase-2
MEDFAEHTKVRGSHGRYTANLSPLWTAWGPIGGYLVAIGLRAMGEETPLRRPASISCHFVSPVRLGEIGIDVTTLKRGKRSHALHFRIEQEGQLKLLGTCWFIDEGMSGVEHDYGVMPHVKGASELQSYASLASDFEHWFPVWHGGIDGRPVEWDATPIPRDPIWRAWMRLQRTPSPSNPLLDAARSMMWMDMMTWNAAIQPHPVPTEGGPPQTLKAVSLDVSAIFHGDATQEEWLLCDAEAPVAREGLIGGGGRLWTPSGRLIASGISSMLYRGGPAAT